MSTSDDDFQPLSDTNSNPIDAYSQLTADPNSDAQFTAAVLYSRSNSGSSSQDNSQKIEEAGKLAMML